MKKFINFCIKPVQFHCEICSMPLPQTEWLRNGKSILNEQHFIINTNKASNENEECLLTVLTIHVSKRKNYIFQMKISLLFSIYSKKESLHENYGRYECRAENFLGHHSDHIDFNQKFSKIIFLLQKKTKNLLKFFISSTYEITRRKCRSFNSSK